MFHCGHAVNLRHVLQPPFHRVRVGKVQDALSDFDKKLFVQPVRRIKDNTKLGGLTFQVIAGEIICGERTDNPKPGEIDLCLESDTPKGYGALGDFFFSAGTSSWA